MERKIIAENFRRLKALGYDYCIMEGGYVSPDNSTIVLETRAPYIRCVQQHQPNREDDFCRCVAELDRLGYLELAPVPPGDEPAVKNWLMSMEQDGKAAEKQPLSLEHEDSASTQNNSGRPAVMVYLQNSKDVDEYTCLCGNTSSDDGFYPCDIFGNEMGPLKDLWDGFYVCYHCRRISYIVCQDNQVSETDKE